MGGGCRCSYKSCINTTKYSDQLNFFHFPIKQRDRCMQWIENSEKPAFYELEEEELKNKVVCEVHFEDRWFVNDLKKKLLPGAVPTLDNCNSAFMDIDSQSSSQYDDIKVVPANDEGTVFVLDTENMFTISPKIESYIIKNGVLVPTNSTNSSKMASSRFIKLQTSNRFTKPSTSVGYVMGAETEIANINTPPGPSNPLLQLEVLQNDKVETTHCEESATSPANGNHSEASFDRPAEPAEAKASTSSQAKQTISSKNYVSRNYFRQIKQHSRDIATIKRMLKQKKMGQKNVKPDMKTVLNELQPQIPASLFTIISLILGKKNDLNEDDIDFFTTLHRSSPEAYEMLSQKYKWNLPIVDAEDSSTE